MKVAIILIAILFSACTTAQLNQTRTVADPIVAAVVSGYAAAYGVPPPLTAGVVGVVQNELWGMLVEANAKQPIAQGSSIPKVGAAVAKVANASSTPNAVLITKALGSLGAL